jgi:hypothetical protein
MSDLRIVENLLFDSALEVTASSEDASFPVSNLTNPMRSSVWRSDGVDDWVMLDTGTFTGQPIDSCMIFFEPGEGKRFSEDAIVKLQANQTNLWSSPAIDLTLTYDDVYEAYTYFFSTSQEYRYWRIKVTDTYNADGYLEIPKIVLGESIQFSQVPTIGFKHGIIDTSKQEQTAYGQVYSDIYSQIRTFEFKYEAFSQADIELLWKLFQRVGRTTPLGIALDTQATLFDKDRFAAYCFMSGDFSADHRFYSYFDTAVSFREAL